MSNKQQQQQQGPGRVQGSIIPSPTISKVRQVYKIPPQFMKWNIFVNIYSLFIIIIYTFPDLVNVRGDFLDWWFRLSGSLFITTNILYWWMTNSMLKMIEQGNK